MAIRRDGFAAFSTWAHSATVRSLYRSRCRCEVEEMTAHRQAIELLRPHVEPGDVLLDAGCGSGYFFHSIRVRNLPLEYFGIDACAPLLDIGRNELSAYGLAPDRLIDLRIEDLAGEVDHALCINVLTNMDNYQRPLERLLLTARKTVILRESISDVASYAYVRDDFLDAGVNLKVHVNTYDRAEIASFIESYGFDVAFHEDEYTGGRVQQVIGYPHWWTFVCAIRRAST